MLFFYHSNIRRISILAVMKKNNLSFFLGPTFLLLISCDSLYYIQGKKENHEETKNVTSEIGAIYKNEKIADKIIQTALKYKGIKYRPGGTDIYGMDCSGFVLTTFKENNIILPRSSFQQSKVGKQITFENLAKGDLVFFRTMGLNRVSHVGIVVDKTINDLQFIHSSSEGVIISSINEKYWNKAYVSGSRIIDEISDLKFFDKNIISTPVVLSDSILNNESHAIKSEITYIVKKGDNLYNIAQHYNKTVTEIKTTNQLTSDNLKIGMVLKIATKIIDDIPLSYIVKRGDSLSLIAKNHNTTVNSIKEINNLTSDKINVGMTLLIL